MKLITRRAAVRLAILGGLALAGLSIGYFVMIRMPLQSFAGPLPELTPAQRELSERLRRDLEHLAGTIGERNIFIPHALQRSAEFIEESLGRAGFPVERQEYALLDVNCSNLEIEIRGRTRPEEIVIVGAHYDSVSGCPGANDNGTGTVALLVLAERLAGSQPGRTLRFVAFVNEEPPHFMTDLMGSRVYAKRCRERGEKIVAMLSLETMGYYSDADDSQRYPFPFGLVYPSRGNFIAFVGNTASGELVRRCVQTFRQHAKFPSEGGALPGGMPGIGWSDHWSFWEEGYPGVMITDTAPFRYPFYHTEEDTPEKVDYDRLARVVEGVEEVIRDLANPE